MAIFVNKKNLLLKLYTHAHTKDPEMREVTSVIGLYII